jgi:hypothetical protein
VAGVITASERPWTGPFTGLSPRQFSKLITSLQREGAVPVRRGKPRLKDWGGGVSDCEAVGGSVDHLDLLEARSFALDCIAALRSGHTNPVQALAANLVDSLMHAHFSRDDRAKLFWTYKGTRCHKVF